MKNNLEAKSGIYKITINDYYIYIGQSKCLRYRINTHIRELKDNKHYNKKFQSVFNKYPNTIKFEVVEYCDIDKLDEREMFYIEQFKSYNTKHGLNMSIGGDSQRKYKTIEEYKAARKQHYQDNIEEYKEYHNQWYQHNKEQLKENSKQYHRENKTRILAKSKEIRRKKGILSWKEKFEKRYNLSRPLTNKEWDTWRKLKQSSKDYAIKFLKTLPNLHTI